MLDPFGQVVEPLYEPVPTTYQWTIIDLLPPETSISYGPAATTASTIAYFGFASDDPTAIIECSLDGAGYSECATPAEFADLLPGPHTLLARAVNLAGNVDSTPARYDWTITPAVTNTPLGTNVTVNLPLPGGGMATMTFLEVTLAGATTLDALNGAPPLPAGYLLAGGTYYDISTTAQGELASLCIPFEPASFPNQAVRLLHFDGTMWIDVTTMSDPAGLVCGLPDSLSPFALAAGSGLTPLASIISGPPNPSSSGTATFTFWSDLPDSLTLCSIDGLPFTPCTSPVTYNYLETGSQEFMVQAVGADGQMQVVPSLYEWEIILEPDTMPPDTTITLGAPALTVNYISWFQFSGSDDQTHPLELTFECSLDECSLDLVPFAVCASPLTLTNIPHGEHQLEVRAVSSSLGTAVDQTPALYEWASGHMTPPVVTILTGPDAATLDTTATFTFSADDPAALFQCSLDGSPLVFCTSGISYTNLLGGLHAFEVTATKPNLLVEGVPALWDWTVLDETPPETTIVVSPTNQIALGASVEFTFSSNEPDAIFECSLNGGPFAECASPPDNTAEFSGLAAGAYTLEVRAVDPKRELRCDAGDGRLDGSRAAADHNPVRAGCNHHRDGRKFHLLR